MQVLSLMKRWEEIKVCISWFWKTTSMWSSASPSCPLAPCTSHPGLLVALMVTAQGSHLPCWGWHRATHLASQAEAPETFQHGNQLLQHTPAIPQNPSRAS